MRQPDLFPRTKERCDGKIYEWTPVWEAYETDTCCCCRQDCEGCFTETAWRDTAEPFFHLGPIKKLPGDKETCLKCKAKWLNFAGVIKKVYSAKYFIPFMREESPFLRALND